MRGDLPSRIPTTRYSFRMATISFAHYDLFIHKNSESQTTAPANMECQNGNKAATIGVSFQI